MTIVVIGSMRFPPDRLESVTPHLERLVTTTRNTDGCLTYDVAFDPFDPGLVRFSETWPDMATLQAHLVAPHIGPWREIASLHGVHDRSFSAWEVSGAVPV